MTRAEYLALAERVERAEGPDRELDAEIGAAIRWHPVGCEDWLKEHETFAARGTHIRAGELKWPAPRFTASLDAALSLVPEGWGWHVDDLPPQTPWASLVRGGVMRHDCHAATPALALVAAALRARAEEAKDE